MGGEIRKQNISVGLLAHVDAGKTTLSEALLYTAGAVRRMGRVDHGDAFLDTHHLERARGITIFSKEARLTWQGKELTLLDTPGHVDFAPEAERALQVMDCAVLVISGTDGVQAHTRTLWSLLRRHNVPTFLFVNKMDLPGPGQEELMRQCGKLLGSGCVSFSQEKPAMEEAAALCREDALEQYLETGHLDGDILRDMVAQCRLFPCFFGSALKLEGVGELLDGLRELAPRQEAPEELAAQVYKISRDETGTRLTHVKLLGGSLRVRGLLSYTVQGEEYQEKIKEIRLYSGNRYTQAEELTPGMVAALVGLSKTYPGQGLGTQPDMEGGTLEPVMTYCMELPPKTDPMQVLPRLMELKEEEPSLQMEWNPRAGKIYVRLMGQVQIEILKSLIAQRFDLAVEFTAGRILYKETIAAPVEGVGHYEPLRHYAEVHLLLEPLPRGSGLIKASLCSEDVLERPWQRLIMGHMGEKTHLGVLTGSPITDMKITLAAGKAHLKHTEGGDFRQATYRAIRQGLMMGQSVLLEPYYAYSLTIPTGNLGRALGDLQADTLDMTQEALDDLTVLSGKAPVVLLQDYAAQVAAYTRGRGRLTLTAGGYYPCKNQDAVVASFAYDPEADLENTPDSVFCAHGAGYTVKWRDVPQTMHLPSCLKAPATPRPQPAPQPRSYDSDKELEKIMEREFGPIRRPQYQPPRVHAQPIPPSPPDPNRKEYLFVDGYNMLFAWDGLKELAREDLEQARLRLMDILSSYAGFKHREVVLIFDGYKVKGNRGERFLHHNLPVVYTRENETCDMYIEALIAAVGRNDRVWVASSDSLIRLSVFRSGVLRMSARELQAELEEARKDMQIYLKNLDNTRRRQEREAAMKHWEELLKKAGLAPNPES